MLQKRSQKFEVGGGDFQARNYDYAKRWLK